MKQGEVVNRQLLITWFSTEQFVLSFSECFFFLRSIFMREIHLDDKLPNPREALLLEGCSHIFPVLQDSDFYFFSRVDR